MKIIDHQKVFGASVRALRELLGITQETLGERAGLHRTYISDVERGDRNPTLKTMIRLAHALEVTHSALFPAELEHWKTKGSCNDDLNGNFVEILLVEDNREDAELALRSFKRARFENRIHVVSDGREALDYQFGREKYASCTPAQGPQLILLDLSLPQISGPEVLRRIKEDERTCKLPVAVLTSASDEAEIAQCRRLGADTFITKPINWQGFSTALNKLDLAWVLLKPPEIPLEVVPA